jgi:hypothetical protein
MCQGWSRQRLKGFNRYHSVVHSVGNVLEFISARGCNTNYSVSRIEQVSGVFGGGADFPVATSYPSNKRPLSEPALECRTRFVNLQSILQSVCLPTAAFQVFRCHPWPCMSLNLRSRADSIPSALTNFSVVCEASPAVSPAVQC